MFQLFAYFLHLHSIQSNWIMCWVSHYYLFISIFLPFFPYYLPFSIKNKGPLEMFSQHWVLEFECMRIFLIIQFRRCFLFDFFFYGALFLITSRQLSLKKKYRTDKKTSHHFVRERLLLLLFIKSVVFFAFIFIFFSTKKNVCKRVCVKRSSSRTIS